MVGIQLRPETRAFIAGMLGLPAEQIADVVRGATLHHARGPGKDARERLVLPAAVDSHIDKQVRDGMRPRSAELREKLGTGVALNARSTTVIGARYIENAHKLTDEEFEGFFAAHRAAGIAVPSRAEIVGASAAS